MRKLILLTMLWCFALEGMTQCADAGRDTLICGYNHGLNGSPDNGDWSYLCTDSLRFIELSATTIDGRANVTVAGCGSYMFIYTVDDGGCTDQDTVTISFEDPGSQTRTYSYNITLDYGTHDCPTFVEDSCSNVRMLEGAFPPRPFWTLDIFGICDATFPEAFVSVPDSSNCTAAVNHLGTTNRDTLERIWTSSQDAFITTDYQNGEIVENRFAQFVQILERGLNQRLDSACYEFDKCFVDEGVCVDSVIDTTVYIMPVHIGGRWNIINQNGNNPLDDTTDISQGGKDYRVIFKPGARYFGPNDIEIEVFSVEAGRSVALDTAVDFIFFWEEEWTTDTLFREDIRYFDSGACPTCGSLESVYDTMIFPDIPTTFCPTYELTFNPPIPFEITGDTVLCEGRFVVLGAPEGKVSYLWSNGTTSRFNFVMSPGMVELESVDSTGCVTRDAVEVIQVQRPDWTVTGDTSRLCLGSCIDLDIEGDSVASYNWSNLTIDTFATYCPTEDSLVWVEVEDLAGCFYRDSFILRPQMVVSVDAGPNRIINCDSSSTVLTPDSAALDTTGFFEWTGPGINVSNKNQLSPRVSEPGKYYLFAGQDADRCLGVDSMEVFFADNRPLSSAGPDQLINCIDSLVQLNGSDSDLGTQFSLEWTGPGIDTNNRFAVNPIVDQPGTYILTNCNDITGCCDVDTVIVEINKNQPRADAGEMKNLSCDTSQVTLGGPNTSMGANLVFIWTGPGINATNENEINPVVSVPGNYFFRVLDTISRCESVDGVTISLIGSIPIADAGDDGQITCTAPEVILDGSNSSVASSVNITWTGPGINAMNRNALSPTVDAPGTYVLSLLDTLNNCTDIDTAIVVEDIRLPDIDAGPSDTIDCNIQAIRLLGAINNDNGRMDVSWTGPGINASNRVRIQPDVNQGGVYILTVVDTANMCTTMDTVTIVEAFDPPIPQAGPDLTLNCDMNSVNLQGNLVNFDPDFALFSWEGPDIDFNKMFELNPNVTLPGTYILSVNTVNDQCDGSDTMEVTVDTIAPIIDITGDMTVGCNSDTAFLKASVMDGEIRTVVWTTNDGTILTNARDTAVGLGSAGTYLVEVIGENGCRSLDSVTLDEWNAFDVTIEADSICEGNDDGIARILIRGGEFPFSFSLNNGPFVSTTSFTGLSSGPYDLVVQDRDGCSRDYNFEIGEIPSLGIVDEEFERNFCESDNLIIGDNFGLIDPQFQWLDRPSANIKRSIQDTGTYVLQIFNACDTANLTYVVTSDLLPEQEESVFRMPNAFTPNNDRLNDEFGPVWQLGNLDQITVIEYQFEVYNRWGEMLYTTDTLDEFWDGVIDGNPAMPQNYFYRIRMQLADCRGTTLQFRREGSFALLR